MLTEARIRELTQSSRPKVEALRKTLRDLRSVLVAFSGGVDSAFLLKVAHEELRDRAVAVTGVSPSLAPSEAATVRELASTWGVSHLEIEPKELDNPNYAQNPANRCYFCKSELFSLCETTRVKLGLDFVIDGYNADDQYDHRPGAQAAQERKVRSPLAEVGLTKDEIRAWSRTLGMSTWDKPGMPCLASRIPYGQSVTEPKLLQIGGAESDLRALGLRVFRVRHHGEVARIEVAEDEYARLSDPEFRRELNRRLLARGFRFVAVDLEPFRSGRLNVLLDAP